MQVFSPNNGPSIAFQQLYGLFKYVTVSPAPNAPRPSIFDMTGRAKWDAWSAAGKAHEGHGEEAEKRYLEIARDLGWTGGTSLPAPAEQAHLYGNRVGDYESSESKPDRGGGSGAGGMGTSVSAMAPPPLDEQDSKSLHGLAVTNNVSGLCSYLDAHPGIDINELDEHGYTALHLACDRGNVAVVEQLLSRGADCSLKDPDDFIALELAKVAGHDNIADLIEKTH